VLSQIAFDTNILAYVEGVRRIDADQSKIQQSRQLIERMEATDVSLNFAAQTMAELRHVLIKKLRLTGDDANTLVKRWIDMGRVTPTDRNILQHAFTLAAQHKLQTYDAIILAAAAESGCDILYSEDMQHGFVWRGVEVINPFI
jgi:predicted nucleic acid-binding protein